MPVQRQRSKPDLEFTLRQVFGKPSFRSVSTSLFFGESNQTEFRPVQREVIEAALDGNDVFLQAATSFGKSLCFQLPACIDYGSKQRPHQVDETHILIWLSYRRRITSSGTHGMCST